MTKTPSGQILLPNFEFTQELTEIEIFDATNLVKGMIILLNSNGAYFIDLIN